MKRFFIFLLKPLSFIPALLIVYMIFMFSTQDGATSSALSYKVSYHIVSIGGKVLDMDLSEEQISRYVVRFHGPIRKIAHMVQYFALAVAVSFPLYVYKLRGFPLMLVAGFICVGIACLDEYNQTLTTGRGGSTNDVLIDSIGIFCGITLVRMVCWTALSGSRRRARVATRRNKRK